MDQRPGRSCPASYRYSPRVFDREPEIVADTLYVVGGLYGNVEALREVERMAARESGAVRIVFNGDFHWFDVDADDFATIASGVAAHVALRGNVETEIASEDSGAGCGCAYPVDVSDAVVSRSNEILARLRETARRQDGARGRLAALPMHLVARVAGARVAIVHGDAVSLAGWGFDRDRLADASHRRWVESMFAEAKVDAFASTHTCMPALARFDAGVVANNGAAGMPNKVGTHTGLLTRIAARPLEGVSADGDGERMAGAFVQIVPIAYDHERWEKRFLASWPPGSPAHASYYRRIVHGS
ncbi:MAG TPA: hypothetical protein VFV90_00475 [Usitatibacter sp.]|nr:hypothetical protein [Usitatibacter sp.]